MASLKQSKGRFTISASGSPDGGNSLQMARFCCRAYLLPGSYGTPVDKASGSNYTRGINQRVPTFAISEAAIPPPSPD